MGTIFLLLADGGGTKMTIADAVYGASTYAVIANLAMMAAWAWIGWRLLPKARTASHIVVISWVIFILAQVVAHSEKALHAYLQYGASWQVSEHGLIFITGWLFGTLLVAYTAPWDDTPLPKWLRRD